MEDERWQAVNLYVGRALEHAPTVRASWLRAACAGDGELLAQAETLLRAATLTSGLLSVNPTIELSDSSARSSDTRTTRRQFLGRIGHYELRDWLGAGGMGEVFLARDLALGRDVALKLLPQRFAPELRLRLMREAEASAKVQHPAIATFYETGEADGEAFIAMEYVHGQTLRRRLADGPLSVTESLAIARCVLEALEHAHAAGVLHRDIKPENVMVTGSRGAKLLDFGLAKHLLAAPASDRVPTGPGAIAFATDTHLAGTLGYMAPEQFLGDSLDERTDVFQVGAVLYEMLTGRPAFGGASPLERMARIMMRDPDFDAVQWSSLPMGLQTVLRGALARDRSERYPTAASLLRNIEDVLEGRVITELPKVLAVLDFENLTAEVETQWVGSAVAEALRASLARLEGLTIVSREKALSTLEALRNNDRSPDAVALGLRLGCGWVLSGSFERSGPSVRVTAQLIEVSTARVAATEVVHGSLDELFSMRDTLAETITTSLGYAASTMVSRRTTVDVQECLARAQLLLDRLDKGAVEQARQLLERAVAIDGTYAPALAALANAYGFRSIAKPDPEDVERALHFANRAIDADPRSAEAHMWKGYALLRQNRHAEAAVAHGRAGELDPANASAPYFAGCSLLFLGRRDQALPLLQHALDLDARSGMAWLALGVTHLCLGQLVEAHYAFTRARETEHRPARYPCAAAAAYMGEVMRLQGHAEARAHALAGVESAEGSDHAYRDTFRAYALVVFGRCALDEGDRAAARAAFQQVLSQARGRPRTRSCGHVVVEALAGLSRADQDPHSLAEACNLFESRSTFNFEPFFGMLDDLTLFELAHSAGALGFHDRAQALLGRAHQAGSRRSLPRL